MTFYNSHNKEEKVLKKNRRKIIEKQIQLPNNKINLDITCKSLFTNDIQILIIAFIRTLKKFKIRFHMPLVFSNIHLIPSY